MLALTIARGQRVAGVRHLVWLLGFGAIWGLWVWRPNLRVLGLARLGFAAMALVVAAESTVTLRLTRGRAQALRTMSEAGLDRLRGRPGIAWDVGVLGYYSRADICDPLGLVNGRTWAELPSATRLDGCAQRSPVFVYASAGQRARLARHLSIDEWRACGRYSWANSRGADLRTLWIRPDVADEMCERDSTPVWTTPPPTT